jgi:hypothetical protein
MQPLETLIITLLALYFIVTGRAEKFFWFINNREDIKSRNKNEGDISKGSGDNGSGQSSGPYIPI